MNHYYYFTQNLIKFLLHCIYYYRILTLGKKTNNQENPDRYINKAQNKKFNFKKIFYKVLLYINYNKLYIQLLN